MKVHTNRFKEEIGSFGRQIDSIITYKLNGVTQTITSENLNGVTPTFQGSILKSVMKQLDVDSNIDIPIGASINYKFGVLVDGKFEYLDFGNYVVYSSEKQEDYDSYKIVCYDKMLYSMKQNEDLGVAYPISVRDYLKALCNKLGLQFKNANDNFVNYSRMIKQELYVGLDYTYRDILDELAQVTASTICLNENDELELRYISNDAVDTIDEEYLKDININFGQKNGPVNSIVLSRSAESDNVYLQDEESVQANGLCELKIVDNQIMNWNDRSDYLPEILNKLDGLEYYINDFASTGIAYLELCDRYNIKIGDKTYSCVMLNDELEITQGLVENIHTDMPEETETDYTKADKTDRKINNVSLIVDKQQKEINALANKVVDISSTASGVGFVNITNGYKGNLHKLDIYGYMELPIIGNIIIGQFKVNNFKIIVEQNDEVYREYILDDMKNLYQVGTVHDTFEYLDGKCSITKKIGIDDKGNKYVLETPYTIDLKDFIIEVPEGDYKIYTNFNDLHLEVEYLLKNEYTDTFATQVDLQSEINIRSDEIELLSKKKVNNDEVIASINLTPEKAQIEANKISLKGKEINMTSDNININSTNFKVDKDGNCTANSFNSNNATITGGKLTLNDNGETINASVVIKNNILGYDTMTRLGANGMVFIDNDNDYNLTIGYDKDLYKGHFIRISGESSETLIESDMIQSPYFNQVSLKEYKKDFEKLDNALSIIKNTDIYKYHLKSQDDKEQKHIGLVIGDEFKYSKEILSPKQNGIDLYSMISTCFKAIQEQQEQIEKLEKRIEKLERNDK